MQQASLELMAAATLARTADESHEQAAAKRTWWSMGFEFGYAASNSRQIVPNKLHQSLEGAGPVLVHQGCAHGASKIGASVSDSLWLDDSLLGLTRTGPMGIQTCTRLLSVLGRAS